MTALVDLLPSRASAPWHCRECDGPLEGGPLEVVPDDCSECIGAGLVQRLEWRYQNGEGVAPLGVVAGVEITREFHPLTWRLAVDVALGREWSVAVSIGPWSLVLAPDL